MTTQEATKEAPTKDEALRKLIHKYNNFLTVVTNRTELALLVDDKKEMKVALEEILSSSMELDALLSTLRETFLSEKEEDSKKAHK